MDSTGDIIWPSESFCLFEDALAAALDSDRILHILAGSIVKLSSSFFHKTNSKSLKIIGEAGEQLPTIIGTGHSIFQIGGRHASLWLENLRLVHQCEKSDKRDIGAVIFALNLSKVNVVNCHMISTHGFGLWTVQRSIAWLHGCDITSTRRSGCVSFGRSQLTLIDCCVHDSKIHNICSRGNTSIILRNCKLENADIRSVYGYHSVHISMEDCTVTGSKSDQHAAIDMWYTSPKHLKKPTDTNQATSQPTTGHLKDGTGSKRYVDEGLKITLTRCSISDNKGIGFRIREDVARDSSHTVEDCIFANNSGGDISHIIGVDDSGGRDFADVADSEICEVGFEPPCSIFQCCLLNHSFQMVDIRRIRM